MLQRTGFLPPCDGQTLAMTNTDQIKGKAKEAVGDLTDNDKLKREGQADKAAGNFKEKVDDVKDKVEDAADAVGDKVKDVLHKH